MFASSRILGAEEKSELSVPAYSTVHALADETGATVAYVREGGAGGRPGYGELWRADDPGVPARMGPLRTYNVRAIPLYSLPMLAFTDSSD